MYFRYFRPDSWLGAIDSHAMHVDVHVCSCSLMYTLQTYIIKGFCREDGEETSEGFKDMNILLISHFTFIKVVNICNLFTHGHQGVHKNSFRNARAFQVQIGIWKCWFLKRGEISEQSREPTTNSTHI